MAANPAMAGATPPSATLGFKAVDSNEVRKKQVGFRSVQETGSPMSIVPTPQNSSDLSQSPNLEEFVTPSQATTRTANKVRDDVPLHQQQLGLDSNLRYVPPFARAVSTTSSLTHVDLVPNSEGNQSIQKHISPENPQLFGSHSPKKDENLSPARQLQQVFQQEANRVEIEDRFTPFKPMDLFPQSHIAGARIGEDPFPKIGETLSTILQGTVPKSTPKNPNLNNPDEHPTQVQIRTPNNPNPQADSRSPPSKPNLSSSSPARNLKEVFQREGENKASEDRISSLVQSLEDEIHKSGVNINLSQLKAHILQVREVGVASSSKGATVDGEFVETECNSPRHALNVKPDNSTKPQATNNPQSKTKDWASLFSAQCPSKGMQLNHYPELKNGKCAVVELEDSHLDDRNWNCCLVGYFLDGKMPFALLSSTARAVWKNHGQFHIKQVGSCFFFEFQDEATKIKVLEGGPYFFSRRYIVLKDWNRMLIPSPEHPSTIPVWIKIHKLPFECWTAEGLGRIASTIGKPLHVDKATEKQMRLDFARVCVEIDAESELPDEVQIKVNGHSIVVQLEYQWLPAKCAKCKVFGHSCASKQGTNSSTSNAVWQVVGKPPGIVEGTSKQPTVQQDQMAGIDMSSPSCLGGILALEAVTVAVPNSTGAQHVIKPSDYEPSDDESNESVEEVIVVENNSLTPSSGVEEDNSPLKLITSDGSQVEYREDPDPKPPNIPVGSSSPNATVDSSPNKHNENKDKGGVEMVLKPQASPKSTANSNKKKQKKRSNAGSSNHARR